MKSKEMMYALGVVLLDVIAAVSVINSSIDPKMQEYKNAMKAGEAYEEQKLCAKAASAYNAACKIKDSEELRYKIAEVYEKGFENGEYPTLENRNSVLDSIVEDYPQSKDSYDTLINYYMEMEDYSSCADYVKKARSEKVSTKTIKNCYKTVKHMYSENGVGYDSIESIGTCLVAKRSANVEIEQYDENGELLVTIDEYGNEEPVVREKAYTEYTYLYDDGTASEPYSCIDMSPPSQVQFGEEEYRTMFFLKNYGNDLDTKEVSEKIYSGLISDGQKICNIDNKYEAVSPFNNGYITLRDSKSGKYSIFSTAGEAVGEPYDFAGCFSNSVVFVKSGNESYIIDANGDKALKEDIDDVILRHGDRCSINNRMFVKFKGESSYAMVNAEKFSNMKFECDDADLFIGSSAAFKKGGKWGFVGSDGKVVIEPEYEEAKSFKNGMAAVKKNGKWGFINEKNEMIIEPKFDDALYFDSTGIAYVYDNNEGVRQIKST